MTRTRSLPWMIGGGIAAAGVILGVVLASGASLADAAGEPLNVPAVSIVPTTSPPTPTLTPDDDSPEVVPGPPPVTVDLDDHGDDDNSGRGNGDDDDRDDHGDDD